MNKFVLVFDKKNYYPKITFKWTRAKPGDFNANPMIAKRHCVALSQISTTAGWAEAWLAMSVENSEERPDRCVEADSNIGSLGSCGRYMFGMSDKLNGNFVKYLDIYSRKLDL